MKNIFKRREKTERREKNLSSHLSCASPVAWLVGILVTGSLSLAIVDVDSRAAFADLAKVGLCGYIALLMPHPGSSHNR